MFFTIVPSPNPIFINYYKDKVEKVLSDDKIGIDHQIYTIQSNSHTFLQMCNLAIRHIESVHGCEDNVYIIHNPNVFINRYRNVFLDTARILDSSQLTLRIVEDVSCGVVFIVTSELFHRMNGFPCRPVCDIAKVLVSRAKLAGGRFEHATRDGLVDHTPFMNATRAAELTDDSETAVVVVTSAVTNAVTNAVTDIDDAIVDTMSTATIDDAMDREKQLNYEERGLFVFDGVAQMEIPTSIKISDSSGVGEIVVV